MEIQNIFTKGLSLTSSTSNEKNKESKEKKIGRYLGKYNLFKANLENKIRSRLNFLKEKVIKNVDEIYYDNAFLTAKFHFNKPKQFDTLLEIYSCDTVVTQLAERLLLAPSLNPTVSNFYKEHLFTDNC